MAPLSTASTEASFEVTHYRIGVVLEMPVLLVAGWIAGSEVWQAWSTSGLPLERMLNADGSVSLEESFSTHHAYFGYAVAWASLAIVLYAAARALGWVIDGFLSSKG